MSVYSIPPLLSSLLFLSLGIFVITKNKTFVGGSFFAFSFFTFWWQCCWFFLFNTNEPNMANFLVRFGYSGIVFLPVAFFFLTASFINRDMREQIAAHVAIGIVFIITIWTTNLFVQGFYRYFFGFYPKANWLHLIYLLWVIHLLGSSSYKLYVYRKNSLSPIVKNQLKFLLIGNAVYAIAATDFLVNYGFSFYPFGFVCISIALIIYAYAIVKHRLLDIHIVIRWSTVVSALAVILTSLYVTGMVVATKYLNMDMMGIRLLVIAFILGTFILFHRTIKRMIESVVLMREKDEKEELDELYQNLATTLDLKEIKWVVISELEAIFRTRCVTLVLFDLKERRFKVYASVGYEEIEKVYVAKESPLVTWLMNNNRPAVYDWLDAEREEDKKVQDVMDELNMTVAMVLAHNDTMVGMLGLAEKKRRRYTADEIVLFAEFCEKMAVPFTNAVRYRLNAGHDDEDEQGEKLPFIPVPPNLNEPGKPKIFFRGVEVKDDPKDPFSVCIGPLHAVNRKWDWIKMRDRYDPSTKEIRLGEDEEKKDDGGDDGGKDAS